jgi:hypothetical protein
MGARAVEDMGDAGGVEVERVMRPPGPRHEHGFYDLIGNLNTLGMGVVKEAVLD